MKQKLNMDRNGEENYTSWSNPVKMTNQGREVSKTAVPANPPAKILPYPEDDYGTAHPTLPPLALNLTHPSSWLNECNQWGNKY